MICPFWQGFWNGEKYDYDCAFRWQNVLVIELMSIVKAERGNKK